MLDAIRFTAAATAKKDFVPELTHFSIEGGRITGFNGQLTLSAPLDVDITARPRATAFLAAVRACADETIALHVTDAGRLAVRAGKFRAYVACSETQDVAVLQPAGETVELGPEFYKGLSTLAPVMGVDASRPWAMGVKVSSGSMFATNNVVMAQYWHGSTLPVDVVLPSAFVHELLRLGQPPERARFSPNAATFEFADGRWMVGVLMDGQQWPMSKIEELLDKPTGELLPLPENFFDSLAVLRPFIDDKTTRVYLSPGRMGTALDDGHDGAAIEIDVPGITAPQAYNLRQLQTLGTVATDVDWSTYPAPCKFAHGKLPVRGAIAGQRF